jgi:hypothetical protein|tara:strand:- start:563 stop:721 length:159 start_codon:yes stop_codon:yes gene_type:complete
MLKHVPKRSGRFGEPVIVFSPQQSPQIKKPADWQAFFIWSWRDLNYGFNVLI